LEDLSITVLKRKEVPETSSHSHGKASSTAADVGFDGTSADHLTIARDTPPVATDGHPVAMDLTPVAIARKTKPVPSFTPG
jgi:hypothetical protein